jgi:hypothetical protein
MILRACYWGTRLCHCMECMVKNARQGIDQSHASRSNIHRTFLWSVNKPRVPFPSLPFLCVLFPVSYRDFCFNSVPPEVPHAPINTKKKFWVSKNWTEFGSDFSKSKFLLSRTRTRTKLLCETKSQTNFN